MPDINLSRRALINYFTVAGDTFAPPPVAFTIDDVPEDFTGSTLKMQVRNSSKTVVKELTIGNGIAVQDNTLQYSISAADMESLFACGKYSYDVEKTLAGIVSTIQYGSISVISEITK